MTCLDCLSIQTVTESIYQNKQDQNYQTYPQRVNGRKKHNYTARIY
ncbi:mCG48978 [Mus musculus]|nr:mCG48978 [Mus musculus]